MPKLSNKKRKMQLKDALNGHTVTHGLGLGPGNNNLTLK